MPLTRTRTFLVACFLLLWGLAPPAFARTCADFDRDGVPDTATLVGGPHPYIRLTFSRTGGFVLVPVRAHPSSRVAADVDRDGFTDLAGASKRRGLSAWRNCGVTVFARHFVRLRPRVVRRVLGAVMLTTGGRRLHHKSPGDAADLATPLASGGKHVELPVVVFLDAVPLMAIRLQVAGSLPADDTLGSSAASRAPPLHPV